MLEMNQLVYMGDAILAAGNESPQFVGVGLVMLLLASLILKSFSIARRPTANSKCAISLGIMLSAVFVLSLTSTVNRFFPVHRILIGLGVLTAMAAMVPAVVLAIIGLVEYGNQKGRYSQGQAQAIWTLSLAVVFFCIMFVGVIWGIQQARLNAQGVRKDQPGAGQLLTFDDLNFKIRSPGKPWVQLDAKKINKSANVVFTRARPQVSFMVIAERAGMGSGWSTEALAEVAKATLRSKSDSYKILEEGPLRRQELDGVQLESDVQNQNLRLFYRHWFCVTNGYIYQLVAWGGYEDAAAVRSKSEEMFSSFSMNDPERQGFKSGTEPGDYHSSLFSYSVKMGGSGWRMSSLMAKNFPDAELTAWDENRNVGLFVIPIFLMGQKPQTETLTQAMAGFLGIAFPGSEIQDEKPIVQGDWAGVEFGYERPSAQGKLIYRVKVLQSHQWAYLIGAYHLQQKNEKGMMLEETLARVELSTRSNSPSLLAEKFSDADKRRQGLVFNEMGMFHYKARQYEKSAVYFQIAFDFEKKSGVFLSNLANANSLAGKRQEALDRIQSNPDLLAGSQSLRATQANLQLQLEQVDNALTNYAALFAEGYRNDDHFVAYITLLSQTKKQDVALAAVENYLKENESTAVRLVEARLYRQKKEFTKAVELLKTLAAKYPYNTEVALSLADTYCQASLFTEAVATCQKQIDAQDDSASIYYLKGCSEFGLKRYREAKVSFEAALKKSPNSTETKSYLDLVSGMLGEGSNSVLKEKIAAVPIPETLLNTMPPDAPTSYTKDYGARYLKFITAISFTKKKEYKRTEHFVVKVIDSSGVAALSTMQFGFDPLSEGIFVNELKVKDEEGKVMTTGDVADYYVVDAASATQVSQKKVLNIPIGGLRPGCLVELTVTRQDLSPPDEFPFTAHASISSFPILEDILLIQGETNALKFAGLAAENGPKSDGGLYWVRKQPEVYKWEPMEQSPTEFAPVLYVGDGTTTWNGEAKKYLEKLGDYLQLDAAGHELAEKVARNSGGEAERILLLARYVQTNYTYKALEFGRRARLPHKTLEIVRNKYGDCKDHALLLQQMLEASGISARLALVSAQGKIQKGLPSLDQFNHMVVYLPAYKNGFFIDCTDKGSDLSQAVPLGLAGKEALILDAANPRFVTIPDYPAGSSTLNLRREVRITNGSDVVVHEVVSLKGCTGSALRTYFKEVQPSTRRNFIDQQLSRHSGEVTGFILKNLDDTQSPLVLELDYVLKGQFHLAGNQLVGKLPDVWEQLYASAEPVDHRVTPFELNYPMDVESNITLAIPEGFREPALEEFQQNLQQPFATSQSEAQMEKPGLKIDYRLQRRAGKFEAAEYGSYRENMVKALGPLEQTVAFPKKL
ncbi:MAG: hypothetical protein JWR26_3014 [Pedosphaera sp.]|nr:hypothetical protein [Pedosphaera sp.]